MESLTSTFSRSTMLQFNRHKIYLSTIQWLSELEFSKTELSLFSKLLDKSFVHSHKDEEYHELLRLDKKVKLFLNDSLSDLQHRITEHEKHFMLSDEYVFSHDEVIDVEHKENENSLTVFRKEMNSLKNELIDFLDIEWKAPAMHEVAF